jgi:hypothetical protein
MRKGNNTSLALVDGKILAFGTGSDACTEHECGFAPVLSHFTDAPYGVTAQEIAESIKLGRIKEIPQLIDMKRISRNTADIVLIEEKYNTILGYARHASALASTNPELKSYRKEEVTGAWDEHSFAICANSPKTRDALRSFHARIQAGHGLFAGLFMPNTLDLSGAILGDAETIMARYGKEIKAAQAKFESKVELEVKSRAMELRRMLLPKNDHSFIWAVWGSKPGEVLYSINPGYNTNANYGGRHTFEKIAAWIAGDMKTRLA